MLRRALLPLLLSPIAVSREAAGADIVEGMVLTLQATPSGRLLWRAWTVRRPLGRISYLTLLGPGRPGGREPWIATWPDGYDLELRALPGWRHRGHPLVALTIRFGAGAQDVVLFAFDGRNPPRRVAEREGTRVEWRTDAGGRVTTLVVFERDRSGSGSAPRCFRWNGEALLPVRRLA